MSKININTNVPESFYENTKSITYDIYTELCYEGNLKSYFSDIISTGLVPNYFSDLLDNTEKLNSYLNSLSEIIGDYSTDMIDFESKVSTNVETKIKVDLPISRFSFFSISILNKVLKGFQQLQIESTPVSSVIVGSLAQRNKVLLEALANHLNVSTVEILSGENKEALNLYLDEIKSLEGFTSILNGMEATKLQSYLKSVYDEGYKNFSPVSSIVLSALFSNLSNEANKGNLKLEDILNDANNAPLLKQYLSNIKTSLNSNSRNPELMQDLNNFSKENNTNINELLSGNNNELLTSYISKVENVSDAASILKEIDSKELPKYLNELYNSNTKKESTSLSILFEYLNLVSENNGVSIDTLLTDSQYSQILTTSLEDLSLK